MNIMDDDKNQKAPVIDWKTQKELNIPLALQGQADPQTMQFLEMIIKLINEGKIVLHNPDTLINHDVYNKLPIEKQSKVEPEAFNLLTAIRDIKDLYDAGYKDTFQILNDVERLRLTKERLEEFGGDLFII
jgi:hypothetical protein